MIKTIHEAASNGYETAGDSYNKGRPEYPQEAIQFFEKELGITTGRVIVDLGAGTGKFTKLIAQTGADIIAIEPVDGMRKKFAELLPQIQIRPGTAEEIPLESNSIDAVIVAQAFHWFNGEKALAEIFRILKPDGKLGMIWNARDESIDWVSKLTDIIDPYEKGAPRYKYGNWKKAFETTALFLPLREKQFGYIQKGDTEMIINRVASISFISALDRTAKNFVLDEVRTLLETHVSTTGKHEIELPYRTDVFVTSKK